MRKINNIDLQEFEELQDEISEKEATGRHKGVKKMRSEDAGGKKDKKNHRVKIDKYEMWKEE